MKRVTFGVTSSPFLLSATLQHHISKYEDIHPEIVSELSRSFYVDDLTTGPNTLQQAYQLYQLSRNILKEGGFTLRKWSSNHQELIKKIKEEEGKSDNENTSNVPIVEEDSSYANITLGSAREDTRMKQEQKVLGLLWDNQQDSLIFRFQGLIEAAEALPSTKRSVLKVIASIYDPIGFISPVVISMKMLFQELCLDNQDWDSTLPPECARKWYGWIEDLKKVKEVRVSRYCLSEPHSTVELHSFCDASIKAYAVVAYLRIESQGTIYTNTAQKVKFKCV
jgi:hypothetical protein